MVKKEMELVAKKEDINNYINENVTEIKRNHVGDNITIPYDVFYKFTDGMHFWIIW
jgi:hypothetical protein